MIYGGGFKCIRKYDLSKIILERVKFFIAVLPSFFASANCKYKNAIYLATWNIYKVQYVGSTPKEFKVRFRNHKSALSSKKTTCEVAVHFNKEKYLLSDLSEFIVIEQIRNIDDKHKVDIRLLTTEAFWRANYALYVFNLMA